MVTLKRSFRIACVAVASVLTLATVGVRGVQAETLEDALASAYRYNPRLDAQRAQLRATDENVAQAMSGYRPQINATGDINYQNTDTRPDTTSEGELKPRGYTIQMVQPIFSGFRTYNAVNEQEANVRAGREILRGTEQDVLLEAVTAYMDVLRDQAIVRLRENNVNVLAKELKATEDRFAVGEVTRTDVAQAQARRSASVSALDAARANLKTSRASYERVVGTEPGPLVEPRNFERLLPSNLQQAVSVGTQEAPSVAAALYREQSARYAVDRIRGELLPEVQIEATYTDRFESSRFVDETQVSQITGRLNVPIYEGGEVYSRVRQAKHIQVGRLQEIEQARSEAEAQVIAAWAQVQAARAQTESDRAQVEANRIALTGVREEERVGQRTLIDVLNQEVELLNAQVSLETTRRNHVVATYTLLAACGKLDAVTMGFTGTAYDPEANYQEVRRKPWGVSITHDDGRVEELPPQEPAK